MRLRHPVLACAVLFPAAAEAHVEGGKIYCMDTVGSGVVTVSSDTGNVTGPTWNPDGSQILYVTTGEAHESHDYAGARFRIVDLPGLAARSLDLPPDVLGARSPAWSPDGTRVAFVGRPAASPDMSHNDLYITNRRTGPRRTSPTAPFPLSACPPGRPRGTGSHSLQVTETSGAFTSWKSMGRTPQTRKSAWAVHSSSTFPGRRTAPVSPCSEWWTRLRDLRVERGRKRTGQRKRPPLLRRRPGLVARRHGDRLRLRPGRRPGYLPHGCRWFFGNPADGQ